MFEYVGGCPQRPEEASDLLKLETQVVVSCRSRCQESNLGPLEEQRVLFTTLQLHFKSLWWPGGGDARL